MAALTQGSLQIQSAVPVMDIRRFEMRMQANTHTSFCVEGIVSDEDGEEGIWQSLAGSLVKIAADNRILFIGIPETVEINHEGRGYHVSITGASMSRKLDHQRKSRSFQDISLTYQQVMEQVLEDIPKTRLYFHEADQAIGKPIYQVEETDWEFIKRLAGDLHTEVVSSIYSETIDVHIGVPDGDKRTADTSVAASERMWSDRKRGNICYLVRTEENWEIGDWIVWEGTVLSVHAKECRLENGLLQFYYTLTTNRGFRQERYENLYMTGHLFAATVLDVQDEQVRVRFDMDKDQDVESAYWYPWRPDMGNLSYCMPEIGESVYVHIGDAAGNEDRAVCGIHRNGSGNAEMNHANRYFTTKDRKRLYLTPDAVGFQDLKQEKPLRLDLQDETGASIISQRRLTIRAQDNIGIKADRILIQAPKEISLVKRALSPTVINMCNGFDTVGTSDNVVMQGGSMDGFPVIQDGDQQKEAEYAFNNPEDIQQMVIGSTPMMEFENSIERALAGCKVNHLGVM